MAIEVFNRYEHKYLMDEKSFHRITREIAQHMTVDKYNEGGKLYTVENIYYDTPDFELIRHSLEKPAYKEKLRLRSYGDCATGFLEIKKKYHGIVNKRRSAIKLSDVDDFIFAGKKPLCGHGMNKQVIEELNCFIARHVLEPKVFIAYDRLAFFEKDNPDLRISFDTNIRSRENQLTFEAGSGGNLLLQNNIYLMEVKTSSAMPVWLTHLISDEGLRRSSFSKYGTYYTNRLRSAV